MHACMYSCLCMHACIYACMHAYLLCMHACIYASMHVFITMHVCMHLCMYACIYYACTHACTQQEFGLCKNIDFNGRSWEATLTVEETREDVKAFIDDIRMGRCACQAGVKARILQLISVDAEPRNPRGHPDLQED